MIIDRFEPHDKPLDTVEKISEYLLRNFGSQQRPYEFLDIIDSGDYSPEVLWRVIHLEWPNFDLIPHSDYRRRFFRHRKHWRAEYLQAEDIPFYNSLPDPVSVFRGVNGTPDCWPLGLFWTTDRTIAEGFALGHRARHRQPLVVSATVAKRHVAGAYADPESEIVLFDWRWSKITNFQALEPRSLEDEKAAIEKAFNSVLQQGETT